MKTIAPTDPLVAFPDQHSEPNDRDLMTALGAAFPPVGQILSELQTSCPAASAAWQYSAQSGWYRLTLLKKRRLFYLIPKRGDFRLMTILGGKAIASLKNGPHASRIESLLKTAKRYPEEPLSVSIAQPASQRPSPLCSPPNSRTSSLSPYTATVILACSLPVRRAMRLNILDVLHAE